MLSTRHKTAHRLAIAAERGLNPILQAILLAESAVSF
jgi:hypothetical protein